MSVFYTCPALFTTWPRDTRNEAARSLALIQPPHDEADQRPLATHREITKVNHQQCPFNVKLNEQVMARVLGVLSPGKIALCKYTKNIIISTNQNAIITSRVLLDATDDSQAFINHFNAEIGQSDTRNWYSTWQIRNYLRICNSFSRTDVLIKYILLSYFPRRRNKRFVLILCQLFIWFCNRLPSHLQNFSIITTDNDEIRFISFQNAIIIVLIL